MRRLILPLALSLLLAAPLAQSEDQDRDRQWVQEMKEAPRGPFSRLRWFCNDGSVHPPKPYPCQSAAEATSTASGATAPRNCGTRVT